jgi:RHS repeat-associated protein
VAEGLPLIASDGSSYYIAGPGGLPLEQTDLSGNPIAYYHHDQIGSTRALTSPTGAASPVSCVGVSAASSGTLTSPFGWAGQYADSESGLVWLRARYYSPSTGQFLSRDPLVAETGEAYGYAGDDPLDSTDPTGLCSINPFSKKSCLKTVENAASQVQRAATDIVAVVPYAGYFVSYYALKGINAVGDRFGPIGTFVSRVVGAPLVIVEAVGLALDLSIDIQKPEDWADESKNHCDRRPINPLHSIPFVPNFLRGGPKVYLPGAHRDDDGEPHVDWEW